MKTQLTRLIVSVGLAVAAAGCQPQATATPTALPGPGFQPSSTPANEVERIDKGVDSTMQNLMGMQAMTGCSVAVVAPGEDDTLARTYYNFGTVSATDDTPVDENTIYEIGSLSKLFTATVLAAEIGKRSMDMSDAVQKFMPSGVVVPDFGGQAMLISHVATNTSGLPARAQGIGGKRKVDGVIQQGFVSDEELGRYFDGLRLNRPPGSEWEYSNLGYGLLGLAVSEATGLSYEQAIARDVGQPLNLANTRVTLLADEQAVAAQGYTSSREKASPFAVEGGFLGAGGLRSSTADLAAFLEANILANGTPMDAAIQFTQQPWSNGPDPAVTQALGWMISNAGRPDETFYKGGVTQGFSSYMAFSRSTQTGFVALCNAPGLYKAVPELNALFGHEATPTDEGETSP